MTAQSKRRLKRFGMVLVAATFMAALLPSREWARALEDRTVDFRLKRFNPRKNVSSKVVVIDIDEQSLKALESSYGRWPLPRRVYKDLLGFISAGNPKAVLFDILFAGEMKGSVDDRELGEVSRELEQVSHAVGFLESGVEDSTEPFALPHEFSQRFAIDVSGAHPDPVKYADYTVPAGPILDRTAHTHVVTFPADSDGVLRRGPLLFQYGGSYFRSLALAAAQAVWGPSRFELGADRLTVHSGEQTRTIPIDSLGRLPILYYPLGAGPKSIPLAPVLASARALLSGNEEALAHAAVSPSEFENAVVIIGGSAVGLNDLKSTPIHAVYPGAMVQATVASNLIEGHFLRPLAPIWSFLAALLLVAAIQAGMIFSRGMIWKLALPLGACGLYAGGCLWAFEKLWLWPMAIPLGMAGIALFDGLAYTLFIENRERRKIAGTLSKYLSPQVAKQLVESGSDPRAEVGREEEISILFSDIRDFTAISEGLRPNQIVPALNAYLARMTDCVFDHVGTLDKFIGDAVMAFWGAPLADADHATHAVRCAMAMHKMLQDPAMPWRTTAEFRTGIGINTGVAIVGNIGSEKRLDYTAIGDNVNLASRIEGMTKMFQVGVLVSEPTYRGTEKTFLYRWIDEVQVKGKTHRVNLYQPLAERGTSEATTAAPLMMKYGKAMDAYRSGFYDEAARLFEVLAQEGDGPSRVYLERSRKNLNGGKAAYG